MTRQYFNWLVSQIKIGQNGAVPRGYHDLFEILAQKEFIWIVPNDENRIHDARDLRQEFSNKKGKRDLVSENIGVTVLEIIVALSRRLEFNAGVMSAKDWAWALIHNLGLDKMCDPLSPRKQRNLNIILDDLIWRTYDPSGAGGFFPLQNPKEDQTRIEIWNQMNTYIIENHLI